MAFGDTGGVITELIITCQSASAPTDPPGVANIAKGDLVSLIENYRVARSTLYGHPLFGEALAAVSIPNVAFPVKVRGVSRLRCVGSVSCGDIVCSADKGAVTRWKSYLDTTCGENFDNPIHTDIRGTVLKDWEDGTVDVLL